jgi:hypothetical protein
MCLWVRGPCARQHGPSFAHANNELRCAAQERRVAAGAATLDVRSARDYEVVIV